MVEVLDNNWVLMQLAALGVAASLVMLGIAIGIRRYVRNRQISRRAKLESEVKPQLMRALYDDEPDLKCLNVFPLHRIEPIVWQLVTKVRGASRTVLVDWLESRGSIDQTLQRTHHRSSVKRAIAAEHLGVGAVTKAIPRLIEMLDDREAEVRIVAARALGKMGDPGVTAPLLDSLVAKRDIPAGIVSMALVHTGPVVVEGLVSGLASPHVVVRSVSAELLGLYGAYGAGRWLMLALQYDSSDEVRSKAASSLGRLGLPKAEDILQRSTAVSEPSVVRVAAATALGRLGALRSAGVLQILIEDNDPEVAGAAAQALVEIGDEGVEVLRYVAGTPGSGAVHAKHWLARRELKATARRRRNVGEVA